MAAILSVQDAVDRWLKSYNRADGYSDQSFDFELEQVLHQSSPDFLLALLVELSQHPLIEDAKSFLGAGIGEELLRCEDRILEKIEVHAREIPAVSDILSFAWEREDMLPKAKMFLRHNRKSKSSLT